MPGRRYEAFDSLEQFKTFADDSWRALRRAEPVAARQKVTLAVTQSMSPYTQAVRLSKIDVSTQKEAQAVQTRLHAGQAFGRIVTELSRNKKERCHTAERSGR